MDTPAIRVEGFTKRYGKRVAADGLSLTVQAGEIYGLVGADGAGKSSLMKAVAGVLAFDAGTVEVFGTRVDSERSAEQVKRRIGFLPQGLGLNLYPDLSIEENVDFFGRLRGVPAAELLERKRQLLEMTRLDSFRARPMRQLSGGMKQKLGLVCTLIHEPDLVILDEPTTGVDPVSRRDFWAILGKLLEEKGVTALVSTAYLDEADRFHRVSLFHEGKVMGEGTPAELVATVPGTLALFRAEPQAEALPRLKAAFPQTEAMGAWLRVFAEGLDAPRAREAVDKALAGIPPTDWFAREPELEDVFVAMLRQRGAKLESAFPADSRVPAASTDLAIEARGLTRLFGDFRAADAVSFSVPQGEIFGLLGANGAGKTTVIKMLTGILKPSSGEGRVAGADMRSAGLAIKERIGYMSQAFSLYHDLSVIENIRLYAGIYGLDGRQAQRRSDWVIGMAGLAGFENDAAGRLPMGLRQRLALGCALVHEPRVLFLDEPTSGVDPIGRRMFWDILFHLSRREGVAILVTTHYMSEAEHCDHLALMYAGRVVADASPEAMKAEVSAESGQLLELRVDRPVPAQAALRAAGFASATLHGRAVHLLSRDAAGDLARLPGKLAEAGITVQSATLRPLSMEDVFVQRITALEAADRKAS
ncbi:ATP-binding cassette domain-containing protein [Zoogloea sp.]|uniref:ATP-binding cassette domain-containing protein n=1 Tax=Zoogloea sp. TaxID=49181 RepID=UPI001DF937F2|nr:ATP-binding cassette domain-containing protein [Zoogloea sp.]MBK6655221.1 ABC transporter ATP-binding protein [Zoogloea sp.]MBK7847061.1 ABC transporter ATP-binding protein [Zoogloea sp.]